MYSKRVIQSADKERPTAISKQDMSEVPQNGITPRLEQNRNGKYPESPNVLTVPPGAVYNENVSPRIKYGMNRAFVKYNVESTAAHPGIERPAQGDIPTHIVIIPKTQVVPVVDKSFNMGIIADLMQSGR